MMNTDNLSPFNSVYRYFYRRQFSNLPSPLTKNIVPDFLLEKFQCSQVDKCFLPSINEQGSVAKQCRFCPVTNYSKFALLGQDDGNILILDTELSDHDIQHYNDHYMQYFEAHWWCIYDAHWIGHDHIISSSAEQTVKYHDVITGQVVSTFKENCAVVKALTILPNHTNIFASSSENGSIKLWDINSKTEFWSTVHREDLPAFRLAGSIYDANSPIASVSTTGNKRRRLSVSSTNKSKGSSIVFANENILVSGGICDGKLIFWDIRKMSENNPKPVKTITYSEKMKNTPGCSDLIVNRSGRMLFAHCLDGVVYQYDIERASYNIPLFQYIGHTSMSYSLKMDLSPDENYIICGGSCGYAVIYHVGVVPQQPVSLVGHARFQDVAVCRWCPSDQRIILSTSEDGTALIHRMKPGSEYIPIGHSEDLMSTSKRMPETVTHSNQKFVLESDEESMDIDSSEGCCCF